MSKFRGLFLLLLNITIHKCDICIAHHLLFRMRFCHWVANFYKMFHYVLEIVISYFAVQSSNIMYVKTIPSPLSQGTILTSNIVD